jgi:RNA polymerase sigma factor (sigma-70 family)
MIRTPGRGFRSVIFALPRSYSLGLPHVIDVEREAEIDLAAFHAGSEVVVRAIYVKHGAVLLRDARRYAGPAEAEAVVHDVFVELLRNSHLRAGFRGGSVQAWLRQIARLKALEHLRRARRTPASALAATFGSNEADLEARDLLARFVAAQVPEGQRKFFGMRFLDRHTQVEIAAHLGIPRSTLEGWEHRLIKQLRAFVLERSS